MNEKRENITASTRTNIARMYGVGYIVFLSWIEVNPDLKKILEPYMSRGKRTLPPDVVKKIFEILGDPRE